MAPRTLSVSLSWSFTGPLGTPARLYELPPALHRTIIKSPFCVTDHLQRRLPPSEGIPPQGHPTRGSELNRIRTEEEKIMLYLVPLMSQDPSKPDRFDQAQSLAFV